MTVRFTDSQHNICFLCHVEHEKDCSLVLQRLAIFSRSPTQIDSSMEMFISIAKVGYLFTIANANWQQYGNVAVFDCIGNYVVRLNLPLLRPQII